MDTTPDPATEPTSAVGAAPVGQGDQEADAARAEGEDMPADAPTDSEGVPVGAADADADRERAHREGPPS